MSGVIRKSAIDSHFISIVDRGIGATSTHRTTGLLMRGYYVYLHVALAVATVLTVGHILMGHLDHQILINLPL